MILSLIGWCHASYIREFFSLIPLHHDQNTILWRSSLLLKYQSLVRNDFPSSNLIRFRAWLILSVYHSLQSISVLYQSLTGLAFKKIFASEALSLNSILSECLQLLNNIISNKISLLSESSQLLNSIWNICLTKHMFVKYKNFLYMKYQSWNYP